MTVLDFLVDKGMAVIADTLLLDACDHLLYRPHERILPHSACNAACHN